jgi:hypothetical protein
MKGFRVAGNQTAKYWAITQWDGHQWLVRVEDYDEVHRGDTTARRLDQVAPNASAVLGAQFGCDSSLVEVAVEARLPDQLEDALQAAERYVAHAAIEVESFVAALRQTGLPGHDIATLLAVRSLHALPLQLRPGEAGR